MADQLNVLVICGSLRKGSYNAALTRALPALVPPELKLVMAPTIGTFPLYNADVQDASGFPAPTEDLAAAIRAADGVLFVTPEYNWSMPGVLKNAIDWLSRMKEQPFKDKPVAIQSCSQGPLGGARMQYHWRMSMTLFMLAPPPGPVLPSGYCDRNVTEFQRAANPCPRAVDGRRGSPYEPAT